MSKPDRPDENIAKFYHQLSKDISQGGRVRIPKDQDKWPRSWVKIDYKTYKTNKKVKLLSREETKIDKSFSDLISSRRSTRNFEKRNYSLTLKDLSIVVNNSIGLNGRMSNNNIYGEEIRYRVHPSGGGRYPLEYYFFIYRSTELEKGIYHYNILENSLEYIGELPAKDLKLFGYDWAGDCACAIFISAIFDRNFRKYGERGYRYILLEAGHVGQNILLSSVSQEIACVPIAGTLDKNIEEVIGIDGDRESLVYTILIG